jgi:hypothetical protein
MIDEWVLFIETGRSGSDGSQRRRLFTRFDDWIAQRVQSTEHQHKNHLKFGFFFTDFWHGKEEDVISLFVLTWLLRFCCCCCSKKFGVCYIVSFNVFVWSSWKQDFVMVDELTFLTRFFQHVRCDFVVFLKLNVYWIVFERSPQRKREIVDVRNNSNSTWAS